MSVLRQFKTGASYSREKGLQTTKRRCVRCGKEENIGNAPPEDG